MSDAVVKTRSNKEIRSYARERLLGNMFIPCMITLFFFTVKNTFELLMQLGVIGSDMLSFIFYVFLFITVNSVFGLIRCGITRFFLSFVTSKKANPLNAFTVFGSSTEVIISASFMLSIISILVQMPYLVYSFFFADNTVQSLLIALIMMLAGNIVIFLIDTYLFPIYFVICDYPDMRLPMVLIMTLSLMNKKQFFKYLLLQISFIPMYFLGFITLGIGLLWVVPYAYTSYAYFYENLCEEYLQNQVNSQDSSI